MEEKVKKLLLSSINRILEPRITFFLGLLGRIFLLGGNRTTLNKWQLILLHNNTDTIHLGLNMSTHSKMKTEVIYSFLKIGNIPAHP